MIYYTVLIPIAFRLSVSIHVIEEFFLQDQVSPSLPRMTGSGHIFPDLVDTGTSLFPIFKINQYSLEPAFDVSFRIFYIFQNLINNDLNCLGKAPSPFKTFRGCF